jgi:hypothetical protein
LSGAPYAGLTRRIEFISSIPITGTSYTSNIQVDDIQVSAVKEPATSTAVALGLAGFLFNRRRARL